MGSQIYFIEAPSVQLVKIGLTKRAPGRRLIDLAVGSPIPLVLSGSYPGTKEDERALHEKFSEHRSHGEWFRSDVASVRREIERAASYFCPRRGWQSKKTLEMAANVVS